MEIGNAISVQITRAVRSEIKKNDKGKGLFLAFTQKLYFVQLMELISNTIASNDTFKTIWGLNLN